MWNPHFTNNTVYDHVTKIAQQSVHTYDARKKRREIHREKVVFFERLLSLDVCVNTFFARFFVAQHEHKKSLTRFYIVYVSQEKSSKYSFFSRYRCQY